MKGTWTFRKKIKREKILKWGGEICACSFHLFFFYRLGQNTAYWRQVTSLRIFIKGWPIVSGIQDTEMLTKLLGARVPCLVCCARSSRQAGRDWGLLGSCLPHRASVRMVPAGAARLGRDTPCSGDQLLDCPMNCEGGGWHNKGRARLGGGQDCLTGLLSAW